ncbi:hypothetical protein BU25DRAFT_350595 [Macroventuria anomochaeta]|uniref:Uncharacterized protein n=1 Tax=Macroventuria anomochaeta TaxID=301207 RepID=A0ACB6RME2_9PLEO|nr:uncharacterized protein BU25DRAFT_350595 [Macroventuria anomochaeta]KAF2623196.1 hypothetical protein BU25DRAFT_350595 [Macroventuria anomochaeta]
MAETTKSVAEWRLPLHSWDTHVHVFEPSKYPYALARAYTPEIATYEQLLAFNGNLTISHTPQNLVLVQPSPYGTDNSLIIDLLKNHSSCSIGGEGKLRAITVFNETQVSDDQLKEWDNLGVRGFRINTEASSSGTDYEHLKARINDTAKRVNEYKNWKCQLFISGEDWDHIYDTIKDLPLPVIADHQGGMKGTSALPANVTSVTEQPGYKSLLSLAKAGHVYIKVSGFYRSSKLTTGGYDDLEPLIKEFAKEVPDRLIWASDWPHTGSGANRTEANKLIPEKFRVVNDAAVLQNVRKWVGPDVWRRMMVDTPVKVYE